ncbi:MAG: UDP-N-acetylmuramate--L-alanine ligase [Oscillospiraceae bacterium]|nr:UDP-N-acetylmuramate--L-alanine ligase [Oscillospiraceae bacterium]
MQNKNILSDVNNTIHFVGIGGVSMSALAEAISAKGLSVRGSDMNEGVYTERVRALGMQVIRGHAAENVDGADAIIRTSAIKDDNPEIMRAKELGIPILERAEAWGILMEEFPEVICISGTHGKTSTTAMMTCIALAADKDPEVMIGADMREIGGVLRISDGEMFIAEACEYCNSFLNFTPTVAVVLNVEEDHLDFFSGIDDIINSFSEFISRTKNSGIVVVNADDKNAMRALELSGREALTFGLSDAADVTAKDISYSDGFPSFKLVCKGDVLADIRLSVLGEHNVKNALAAAAAAIALRISPEIIAKALASFTGVGRRMEYKGNYRGARIYDDYAHHPSEVKTTLEAVRRAHSGRIICVFQPHTYTRCAALKDDFARVLPLADKVILADIYAAREKNTMNIDSSIISSQIEGAEYISGFENIVTELSSVVSEGDFVITMGAGDIYKVGEMLADKK